MLAGIYGRATSGRADFSTCNFEGTRTRMSTAFSGLSSGREHFSTMVETDFYHPLPLVETQSFDLRGKGGFSAERNLSKFLAVSDSLGKVPFIHS